MKRLGPGLALLTFLSGCSGEAAPGPEPLFLIPGLYVLGQPGSPGTFEQGEVNYADTLLVRFEVAYDSLWIVSDTNYRRSWAKQSVVLRPGVPPETNFGSSATYGGTVLHRSDAIVLVAPPPFLFPISTDEFHLAASALVFRQQVVHTLCTSAGCVLRSNLYENATYVRR